MTQQEYQRRYYLKHKAKVLAKNRKRLAILQAYVQEVKSQPCQDCGQEYPHFVMDFDHVRGTKKEIVSKLVALRVGMKRLKEEIAKCDIVCANCHRVRTFREVKNG